MTRRLIAFLLLLAVTTAWVLTLRARQDLTAREARLELIPARLAGRTGFDLTLDERTLVKLQADRSLSRLYVPAPGSRASMVQLFVAYFGSQKTGGQIHSPQNCLPAGGWKIRARTRRTVSTPEGPREVNEFLITKGSAQQVVQYWFLTRSGMINDEFALKWDLVRNSLLGRPTDAAFIRLVVPVPAQGIESARTDLLAFGEAVRPSIASAIPIAPRSRSAARAS